MTHGGRSSADQQEQKMTRSYNSCSKILGVALLAGLWAIACSSDDNNGGGGATGGATGTGGKASTSTTAAKTGGAPSTSNTAKTGGAPSTGGAQATGTGGAPSTGTGTKPTGGVTSTSTSTLGGTGPAGGTTSTRTGTSGGVGGITTTGGTGPDAGGSDASVFSCSGCLKLYVPLEAQNTGTEFEVDYGTSTTIDLTNTTVTAHVYVDTAGTAGGLRLYGKNDDFNSYATVYSTWENLSTLDGGWHDISLNFAALAAGPYPPVDGQFDKAQVRWLGFNIAAGAAYDGGVFDPVTVYVDWIKFTPVATPAVTDDFTFATTIEGFGINSGATPLAGSTYTWYGQ
jgi:hypothetical protein